MNEAETRAEYIDPALAAARWGIAEGSRIRREYLITPGRIEGHGHRGKPLIADYVLLHRNHKLAVIEAKAWDEELTEGVGQAKNYAGKLAVRFAYSTNGQGIYAIDMKTGKEGPVPSYPSPDELWAKTFAEANAWRDRFAAVPFEDKGGSHPSRYYQDIAVERVMEAIAADKPRILLTLATGTGKTFIAFQIAWKLFYSRWNLSREPSRRPRILFLADRNILANQAYNQFSAFPEDAMVRIAPDDIRMKGKVPKNGSLFFTIFQTFMSGPPTDGEPSPYFGDYPPDFFDFIVIDECHRGGANDESNWRAILDYFEPAVQLGMTATPKRKDNVDTYAYFGEPVYIYSLKEGINDGFLTPFKVKQISTTLDEYVYTADDQVVEGEVQEGKIYTEPDFNKIIEIREREAYRVNIFMGQIDQREKTLVFCATQDHALAVRDLVNQMKTSSDPNYCQRVTANDGALGDQHLRDFQDNEKTIPTILTTSQKLSTGVDARNIRNIVLMRPINSMIEFKQIIGRGTRLYDGKDYFTIYDFVEAHHHFSDPEWDGEPLEPVVPQPCPLCGARPCVCEKPVPEPCALCGESPCVCAKEPCPVCGKLDCVCEKKTKAKVKLADGKERTIQHMMCTTFWHPDGTPMSAQQFMEMLFGRLPEFFRDESELRELWSAPDTRKKLLQALAEKGFGGEQLAEMQRIIDAENSDLFDVLAHVAYALQPETRAERAARAKIVISSRFDSKQQVFLDFVLSHYVRVGVHELDQEKLTPLLRLKYHNSIADALADLGRAADIGHVFAGFQKYLYQPQAAAEAATSMSVASIASHCGGIWARAGHTSNRKLAGRAGMAEDLRFDCVKKDRGRYFVEYQPPEGDNWFATLQVVIVEPMNDEDVAASMESEVPIWLARYPVPLMVTSFDDAGDMHEFKGVRAGDYLMGYFSPETGELLSVWQGLGDDEIPHSELDDEALLRIFADIPVTRATAESIKTEFDVFARKVRTGRRLVVAWLLVWLVAIPLAWALAQWAGPHWLGTIVFVYCIYKALIQILRLAGVLEPSRREREKQEKQRRMEHYYEECEKNPEGFTRLKLENFEREARAQTMDEVRALRKRPRDK